MLLDNEQFTTLANAALDVWSDTGESKLRNYSGRGMFGKQCLGYQYRSIADAVLFIGFAVEAFPDDWTEMFNGAGQDSMGLGAIIYWPNLQISEETQDFLDEDEE